MPIFRYEVTDAHGTTLSGAMDAPDEPTVRCRLAQRGYTVVRVVPASHPSRPVLWQYRTTHFRGRVGPADQAVFFRQLASLLRAGIAPFRATSELAQRTTSHALRHVAEEMRSTSERGGSLADAMARYPDLFAPHIIATVQAAQTGGFLDIACDEIAQEYEYELAFYKGMWLPRALVIQSVLAISVAQPLFPTLFPDNDLRHYLLLAFVRNVPIALALIAAVRWVWRRVQAPAMAGRRAEWALGLPVFGDLARQRSLAAFVRMLRRLYAAGILPVQAWEGAAAVVPNAVIRERLVDVRQELEQGVPLHEAYHNTGLFASETEHLIATGVMSGEVIEMLDRIAEYYQRNVERATDAARFWMYRLAFSLFLALSGLLLVLMLRSYFDSVFRFTEGWVD